MNIPLETFELHFNEQHLLAGERIFDEGGVHHAQKIDNNLWIAEVTSADGTHEVELILTRKNLKKATCECNQFLENGHCGHIVASLFTIRKQRTVTRKPTTRNKRKKSSSISLPAILNNLTREELLDYVKTIARQRKDIANDLKLKYAYRIPHYPAKSKYQDILYTIFRPHIKKGTVSINQAKSLFSLLKDLVDQATDFAALKQFDDSVYASLAAIQKINYLYRKIPEDKRPRFADLLVETYQNVAFILDQDIAPNLYHEAIKEIEELATTNYYQWEDILNNYLLYLWEKVWDNEGKDEFLNEILPDIFDKLSENEQTKYLALSYLFMVSENIESEFLTEYLVNIETPQFRRICKMLFPHKALEVYALCERTLKLSKDWRLQKYCFDILSKETENQQLLLNNVDIVYDLMALTADLNIAEWLINHDPKIKESVKQIIELVIRRQPNFKANKVATYFYYHLDMTDDLINQIVEDIQVDYFKIFASELLATDPSKAQYIFMSVAERYLDHHLGSMAHDKINSILTYLDNEGALEIKETLESFIKEKYAHRVGLTEQVS